MNYGVQTKYKFRNCKVFITQIKNSEKKIKEGIIWHTCDSLLPVKMVFSN